MDTRNLFTISRYNAHTLLVCTDIRRAIPVTFWALYTIKGLECDKIRDWHANIRNNNVTLAGLLVSYSDLIKPVA